VTRASTRCAGCATRACASSRSTAARPSRSTAIQVLGRAHGWNSVRRRPGLVNMLTEAAKSAASRCRYQARALDLLYNGLPHRGRADTQQRAGEAKLRGKISGARPAGGFGGPIRNGGTRYPGPPAGTSPSAGSRFNAGDGIRMALSIGPARAATGRAGHAVGLGDERARDSATRGRAIQFQKHSYPFAHHGQCHRQARRRRGCRFRNYTYANTAASILGAAGQFAWQIFDQKVEAPAARTNSIRQITKVTADTIEELAKKLDGVHAAQFGQDYRGIQCGGA